MKQIKIFTGQMTEIERLTNAFLNNTEIKVLDVKFAGFTETNDSSENGFDVMVLYEDDLTN